MLPLPTTTFFVQHWISCHSDILVLILSAVIVSKQDRFARLMKINDAVDSERIETEALMVYATCHKMNVPNPLPKNLLFGTFVY